MRTNGRTVLITGGGAGIGLAFAERFYKAGSTVVICGRREEKLKEAQEKFPGIHYFVCDVSREAERNQLVDDVLKAFPELDVIINNAGIQQWISFNRLSAAVDWSYYQQEIAANLEAPIHLTLLFLPHLRQQAEATLINISSGLSMAPAAWAPVYSATKAALHSFSLSLRLQLAGSNLEIVEVFPPAVNTDLGGAGLHTFGAPVDEFADGVFAGLARGDLEIGYGGTENRIRASREELDQAARGFWKNFSANNPEF